MMIFIILSAFIVVNLKLNNQTVDLVYSHCHSEKRRIQEERRGEGGR